MPKGRTKANGEGTVFKRIRNGRTRWYAEVVVGWAEGKKQTITSPAFDKREQASGWLADRLSERNRNALSKPSKETVGQFLADWLTTTVALDAKPKTLSEYRSQLRRYILPEIGDTELNRLTAERIQALYHSLASRGMSANTIRLVHVILHKGLEQAAIWRKIPSNPAELVRRPKVTGRQGTPLDLDQAKRFLDTASCHRLHALWMLAVSTGMRVGELLGLRWGDVDLEKGTLRVSQTLNRVDTELFFDTPKTESSKRMIDLPAIAVHGLRRWRAEQGTERLRCGPAWNDNDLVFSTQLGTPINPSNLRKWFRLLLVQADCPIIRLHDLRHTAATLMIVQGEQPNVVQEILGHSDVATTLRIYTHVWPKQKKEAAERMNTLLATPNRKAR